MLLYVVQISEGYHNQDSMMCFYIKEHLAYLSCFNMYPLRRGGDREKVFMLFKPPWTMSVSSVVIFQYCQFVARDDNYHLLNLDLGPKSLIQHRVFQGG